MAVKIEKETIIGDVLDIAPHAAPLFVHSDGTGAYVKPLGQFRLTESVGLP